MKITLFKNFMIHFSPNTRKQKMTAKTKTRIFLLPKKLVIILSTKSQANTKPFTTLKDNFVYSIENRLFSASNINSTECSVAERRLDIIQICKYFLKHWTSSAWSVVFRIKFSIKICTNNSKDMIARQLHYKLIFSSLSLHKISYL